ncbi:hypothetical protein ISCGN_000298 [Ixodes scapularis]
MTLALKTIQSDAIDVDDVELLPVEAACLEPVLGNLGMNDFVNTDANLEVCGLLTHVEMVHSICAMPQEELTNESSDDEEKEPRPSAAEVQLAEWFFAHEENAEHALECILVWQDRLYIARFRAKCRPPSRIASSEAIREDCFTGSNSATRL